MKVVLSSHAAADLRGIARFIAQDDPQRAASFVTDLRAAAMQLADLPKGYPLVPLYEQQGIRRRTWRGYGILYSETNSLLFVHRVIGPGQDLDRALQLT